MWVMGWCHEFGVTVREDCGHPMRAGESACQCPQCGVVCEGQFNGCATVWAAGPRDVVLVRPDAEAGRQAAFAGAVVPPLPANGDAQAGLGWPSEASPPTPPTEPVVQPPAAAARRRPLPPVDAGLVAAAGEGRSQVFEWLDDSFESVNSQLRVLADTLHRQHQALADMSDAQAAAGRLSQLADALPERIGAAVQEAVWAGRRSAPAEPPWSGAGETPVAGQHAEQTEASLADAVVADVRQPNGAEQHHAGAGHDDLPFLDDVLDEPPEPRAPVTGEAAGVGTQISSMASDLQSHINRSGWQEKLRSLSTR